MCSCCYGVPDAQTMSRHHHSSRYNSSNGFQPGRSSLCPEIIAQSLHLDDDIISSLIYMDPLIPNTGTVVMDKSALRRLKRQYLTAISKTKPHLQDPAVSVIKTL
mmetsp:Transcript_4981/g.7194  ORF Transcript_4981/g.7194 Transcript_4981/m.7194 type:complete len:105 (-) Transcript_4981:883-1197(-)